MTETSAVVLFGFPSLRIVTMVVCRTFPGVRTACSGMWRTMAGRGGGIALLQDVVQVGKPARSHSSFKMMGSFPELHLNTDQNSADYCSM
jgi:hypothetical protein